MTNPTNHGDEWTELERLAKAAEADNDNPCIFAATKSLATFNEAANPQAVLSLIASARANKGPLQASGREELIAEGEARMAAADDYSSLQPQEAASVPSEREAVLLAALEPFARAGRLFSERVPEDGYVENIYSPAAGREYSINGDHLRAARNAVEAARANSVGAGTGGWRPIETAPKDGTNIHAFEDDCQTVVFWDDDCWRHPYKGGKTRWNPTHWMPLPDAPAHGAPSSTVGEGK